MATETDPRNGDQPSRSQRYLCGGVSETRGSLTVNYNGRSLSPPPGYRQPPTVRSHDRERVILAGLIFTVLLSQVLLYPGIPDLVTALGADTDVDASMWFLSAEFAGYIAFVGLWGLASDRLGRRRPLIALGAIGGAIGYGLVPALAILWAVDFTSLLAIRFIQGALTIGAFSLAMTMLMDLPGGHGRNMAAAGLAIGLGTGMGAPIGGQLTEFDPVAPMLVASVLLALVGVGTLFVPDRVERAATSVRATLVGLANRPTLLLPFAFSFIDRLTAGFFALAGTLYFRSEFGLSAGETGIVLALFFFPFAVFQYPFGIVSDRIGRTIPIVVGSGLYGVGVIAVGLAPSVATAGVALVAIGILGAAMVPATIALVNDLTPTTDRATAMSGFNLFGSIGFLTGFLVGGTAIERFDFLTAFVVAGGLEIVLAAIAIPWLLALDID